MMTQSKIGWFFLLIISTLIGCSGSQFKDLQLTLDEIKKQSVTHHKNMIAALHLPAPVVFQFAKSRKQNADNGNPLLTTPLDALKFVGTVTQGTSTMGYILAPNNMIYQVKMGDIIGDHYGKITKIETSKIEVVEMKSEGGKSAPQQQIVVLQLKE